MRARVVRGGRVVWATDVVRGRPILLDAPRRMDRFERAHTAMMRRVLRRDLPLVMAVALFFVALILWDPIPNRAGAWFGGLGGGIGGYIGATHGSRMALRVVRRNYVSWGLAPGLYENGLECPTMNYMGSVFVPYSEMRLVHRKRVLSVDFVIVRFGGTRRGASMVHDFVGDQGLALLTAMAGRERVPTGPPALVIYPSTDSSPGADAMTRMEHGPSTFIEREGGPPPGTRA
jgi:hypothetical protein